MLELRTLGLSEAQRVMQAVVDHQEATGHGSIAVVVVDKSGEIIAGLRTDGAAPRYFKAAHRKAYTAAVMERDTSAVMDSWNNQRREGMFGPQDWNDSMLTSLYGGICVVFDSEVVGGIGVAGGRGGGDGPTSDWSFALAGLAGLGDGFSRRAARGRVRPAAESVEG